MRIHVHGVATDKPIFTHVKPPSCIDLVSIGVYLVTWNSLRKKNRQIHIQQQQEQKEQVQGGPIFVIGAGGGGDADSVSSSSTVATSREKEDEEQEESEQVDMLQNSVF